MTPNSQKDSEIITEMDARIDQRQAEGYSTQQLVDAAAGDLSELRRDVERIKNLDIPVSAYKELLTLYAHATDAVLNIKEAQMNLKYGKKTKKEDER